MRKRKSSNNEGINDVYTVETIYKKKMRNNKEPLYFIKWKDWDDKYNSWEPLSNILDHSLIETFEDEIRQKQKLRKDASKSKKLDWDKLDYESDVKSESHDEMDVSVSENVISEIKEGDKSTKEISPKPEEEVSRPKICLKIPKYRLQPPLTSNVTNSLAVESNSPEIEEPHSDANHIGDEQSYKSRLSPIYLSKEKDLEKPIKDESPRQIKLSKKEDFHKIPKKHISKIDTFMKKPQKLLSINEYSAAIKMKKKHHKKSKHSKHRSENKIFQSSKEERKTFRCIENNTTSKKELKTTPDVKPVISVEKKMELLPKSQLVKTHVKDLGSKLEDHKYRLRCQTIITDVTVNGLCVTIKEMSYDDFINDSCPRHQIVKVPKNSDWLQRYLGNSEEKQDITEKEEVLIIDDKEEENEKQKMLDKFEELIIPGLRPPSRPRSVDSYKNIMEKTLYSANRNNYSESLTPNKLTTTCLLISDEVASVSPQYPKSPLNIIVDESEEVDVVGGIESDNSYLSSLQSTRTTVTTQLRQARLSNQSPVSSIIQSLWHSYSYNSPLTMPPLQAAPWVQTPEVEPFQQSRPLSQHYLSRSSSIDPCLLKYTQSAPLSYFQHSSNILSNLYIHNGEERPIDLSFK